MTALLLDIGTTAAIMFVVATGLMIVFGIMKIINFAHAAFLTVGGYVAFALTKSGLDIWLALPVGFCVGVALGGLIERFVVRRLYDRPLDAILATWGIGLIIGQMITLYFGRGVQLVQPPLPGASDLFGIRYPTYRLAMIAIAGVLATGLALVFRFTRFGLNARAVTTNEPLARSLGINAGYVRTCAFCFGCGLAALAGVLVTPLASVEPSMGVSWLMTAFMIVLLSGPSIGSLMSASLILGTVQVVVGTLVTPVIASIALVLVAVLILRFKPEGLLGG
jgi:urea transport system permease protein